MIGEDEYHTWDTLPDFAKRELEPRGYRITTIQQDTADKNNFPGLVEALRSADLLFVSVRRRTPPVDQLTRVRAHSTAASRSWAFARRATRLPFGQPTRPPGPEHGVWQAFDPQVLGGHYTNHHPEGPRTIVTVAPGARGHQILKGVDDLCARRRRLVIQGQPAGARHDAIVDRRHSRSGSRADRVDTSLWSEKCARVLHVAGPSG